MNRRNFLQVAGSLVAAASLRIGGTVERYSEGDKKTFRTPNGSVECVLVRNVSGKTLLPNRIVEWKSPGRIGGYAKNFGMLAGVVMCARDGVRNGRLFWLAKSGWVKIATVPHALKGEIRVA